MLPWPLPSTGRVSARAADIAKKRHEAQLKRPNAGLKDDRTRLAIRRLRKFQVFISFAGFAVHRIDGD